MSDPTANVIDGTTSVYSDNARSGNEFVLSFARALMEPGDKRVVPITPDNGSEPWTPLTEVVEAGRAFSVALRHDIIAFDGDDDDSDQKALLLAAEMETDALKAVAWASGRPGHAQVVVVCQSIADQEHWRERATELGFEWKRRTRPPLSPHRLGHPVSLIYPTDPNDALARLQARLKLPATGKLTPRTARLLRHGNPDAPSPSEVVFQVAMGAVAKGVPLHRFEAMLANEVNAAGESYRRREAERPGSGKAWLHRFVWPKAQEWVLMHPPITSPDDARDHLDTLRQEVAQFPWQPVEVERQDKLNRRVIETCSPNSQRRGMEAILDLADRAGSIEVMLSNNLLVRASGMSIPTVRKVRKVIERQGWITEIHPHTTTWAGTYRIELTGTKTPNPPIPGLDLRLYRGGRA